MIRATPMARHVNLKKLMENAIERIPESKEVPGFCAPPFPMPGFDHRGKIRRFTWFLNRKATKNPEWVSKFFRLEK